MKEIILHKTSVNSCVSAVNFCGELRLAALVAAPPRWAFGVIYSSLYCCVIPKFLLEAVIRQDLQR